MHDSVEVRDQNADYFQQAFDSNVRGPRESRVLQVEESVNNRRIKIGSRCRRQDTLGAVIQMRYRVRLLVRRGFTAASVQAVQLEIAVVDQVVERHRPSIEYHSTYEDEWIAQASLATDRGLYQA